MIKEPVNNNSEIDIFLNKVEKELKFVFKQLIHFQPKRIGIFCKVTNNLNSPHHLLGFIDESVFTISTDISDMKNFDVGLFFDIQKSNKNNLSIHYANNIYYITFLSNSDETYLTYGNKLQANIPKWLNETLNIKRKRISRLHYLELCARVGIKKENRN